MRIEMFTVEEIKRLRKGEVIEVAGKRYRICYTCKRIIRVDKPIFGSLHLCE